MNGDPDSLENNPISRDGSFFSLNSVNSATSVYYSAKETLPDEGEEPGASNNLKKEKVKVKSKKSENKSKEESESTSPSNEQSDESSTTLAEAESLRSFSVSDLEDDNDTNSLENGEVEVKADVSRICNEIAEADKPNYQKHGEIELAGESLEKLRKLAISEGGLLSNVLRKRAWPILLGISMKDIEQSDSRRLPKKFPNVEEQIQNLVHMDVARVLKRFPPGLSDPQQDHLQSYLNSLICSVLEKNPTAYYYQGFHDISLTFLLVCISQSAPYLAYLCLNKLVQSSLAPYMEMTMESTHDLIHVMFALIEKEDPALYKKIVLESKCPVAFCLAWVLTWFSHTLPNDTDVFRLYDFVLGCMDKIDPPCLVPVFISAALVLRNSEEIKTSVIETDIASMHSALSKLPSELESLEPWLINCLELMKKYSGQETVLIKRAIEIKEMQSELWNEDTNNNRNRSRNRRPRDGMLVSIGKFVFVKYRWYTVAAMVVGTAYLIQAKYGRSNYAWNAFKNILKECTPGPLQWVIKGFVHDNESEK